MALTTLARVSAFKALSDDTAIQARATDCLNAASAWFETQVGRELASAPRTVRLSGNNTPALSLPHKPCTAVASLAVNGETWTVMASGDADTGQQVFLPDHGKFLIARSRWWPRGAGNIQLTYTAGYVTIPDDIQQVVVMMTWLLLNEVNYLGITAKSLGPEQVNMVARDSDDYQFMKDTVDFYSREW